MIVDFCVRTLACFKKKRKEKATEIRDRTPGAHPDTGFDPRKDLGHSLLTAYTQTINHVLTHFSHYSLFLNEIKTDLCSHPSVDSHFTGTSYYSIVTGMASAPPWVQSWRQPSEDTLYLADCRRLSTFLRRPAVSLHHGQT